MRTGRWSRRERPLMLLAVLLVPFEDASDTYKAFVENSMAN